MTSENALTLVPLKFASGQALTRKEDLALLRGEGRYTDDVHIAGEAHGVVLRSPYGHAKIRALDVEAARQADIKGADIAAQAEPQSDLRLALGDGALKRVCRHFHTDPELFEGEKSSRHGAGLIRI